MFYRFFFTFFSLFFLSFLFGCALFGPSSIANKNLTLLPFKSDGCSAYSDGLGETKEKEWLHCCVAHDAFYWIGGESSLRKEIDNEFSQCVSLATNKLQGKLMKTGVRIGGGPQTGFPWRWGFGWDIEVPYFEVNEKIREKVRASSETLVDEFTHWSKEMRPHQINYLKSRLTYLRRTYGL